MATDITTPNDTTLDDPEEFTADAPVQPVAHTISLDELDKFTVDTDTREKDYQAINPPKGDWDKEERWEFDDQKDIYIKEGDSAPGDLNPKGRTYITVRGYCKPRVENGITYSPLFTMRMSFDKRLKNPDDPTSLDLPYRLYLDACEAYLAINGKKASGRPSEMVRFLIHEKYTIQYMKGDNGLLVTKVKKTNTNRRGR